MRNITEDAWQLYMQQGPWLKEDQFFSNYVLEL